MRIRKGGKMQTRRDLLKGLGLATAATAIGKFTAEPGSALAIPEPYPSESVAFTPRGERGPEHFAHASLQAAPQWTLLEDGSLALWMLGNSSTARLKLIPEDARSARLMALAGLPVEEELASKAGGVFLLRSRAAATRDALE